MPRADKDAAEQPEDPEHDETQQGREGDRGEQLLRLQPGAVVVDQATDARLALAEEEIADDGADDRQAGRDPPSGDDGGKRARQLELDQRGL